jgi:hypothetical protein
MTIKPYVFNNYEKALPEKSRGQYAAQPVGRAVGNKHEKAMA